MHVTVHSGHHIYMHSKLRQIDKITCWRFGRITAGVVQIIGMRY